MAVSEQNANGEQAREAAASTFVARAVEAVEASARAVEASERKYRVFRYIRAGEIAEWDLDPGTMILVEEGLFPAEEAETAIKDVAAKRDDDEPPLYGACPERYWKTGRPKKRVEVTWTLE